MCEIKRLRDMEPGDRFLCTLPNLLGECVLLEHRDDQLSGVRCLGNEKANIVCSNTSVVVCTDRDELAAELERVKADRDEIAKMSEDRRISLNSSMKVQAILQEDADELESLKSRLPVNADGDVIVIGEPQFIYFSEDGPVDVMVHAIHLRKFAPEYKFAGSSDSDFLIEMEDWARGNLSCHSTAESCRAAHE